MKRVISFFIFLFFIACVKNAFPCPVEGPNMPNNKMWKTGIQTNIVSNTDMKSPKGEISSNQYFLTGSFGITDWACFDGKLGAGDITFDIRDSQKIEYSTNFAGAYGARILLHDDKKNAINYILGLHHISVHPNSAKIDGVKHDAIFDEWQASVLVSKKILKLSPYIAGKFSKFYLIRKVDGSRKRIRSEDNWGLVVGADLDIHEGARLNVEGRFFDESSLTFGFNYTF